LAVLMIVTLAAVPSSAATIALSKTSMSLTKGYATTLKVTGTTSKVTWSTGDKTIATVSTAGKVVGKKVGTTYIYAQVSGKTLKCKVTVVPGKISASQSSVSLENGGKTTVTITALGTHVISAASTNKNVVKATWSGAKFDGDKIKLTLTATGNGTARVKVYAKNYSSTVYKYIDVTVGDSDLSDDDTGTDISSGSSNITIVPMVENVSVAVNESTTIKLYASQKNSVKAIMENTSIAKATVGTSTTNYIPITITGYTAGNTSLKVAAANNTSNYVSIPVTVTGGASAYYTIVSTKPAVKNLQSDTIIEFNSPTGTRYMLVPYGYDLADVNTRIATNLGYYDYYKLYTVSPTKRATSDTVQTISTVFGGKQVTRYVLVPQSYDQVQVDTELAKYVGRYEYYKVYAAKPVKISASDEYVTWTKDIVLNNQVQKSTRYVLVPFGMSDVSIVEELKNKDLNTSSYSYYTPLDKAPTVLNPGDSYFFYINPKTGAQRFMILPQNYNFVKRNDAVYSDTGIYCYFTVYSTKPVIRNANKEQILPVTVLTGTNSSSVSGYMLIDTTNANKDTLQLSGINGTYNSYPQS
ncbi:MAG: Ig domain-containing protein, partial [Oscillospiraceae bacterium]